MAMRLYLRTAPAIEPKPNTRQEADYSITQWLTNTDGGQDGSDAIYPLKMVGNHGTAGRVNYQTFTEPGATHYGWCKAFVSRPLAAQTISGTFTFVADFEEGSVVQNMYPHLNIYVWKSDDSGVRGYLFADGVTPTGESAVEADTTRMSKQTFWTAQAISSLAVSEGDVIVVEIAWCDKSTKTSAYEHGFDFNGPTLQGADAGWYDSYLEFSMDIKLKTTFQFAEDMIDTPGFYNNCVQVGNDLYVVYQGCSFAYFAVKYTGGVWGLPTRFAVEILPEDGHRAPAIVRSADGYLHVFFGAHDGPVKYYQSMNPNDVTGWTDVTTRISTPWGNGTYPLPIIDPLTNKLFLFFRNGNQYSQDFISSTDNGTTWTQTPTTWLITDGSTHLPYLVDRLHYIVNEGGTSYLYIHWDLHDTAIGKRRDQYIAKINLSTLDVYNMAGTNLGPQVSYTEMENNCKIFDSGTLASYNGGTIITPDGTLAVFHYEYSAGLYRLASLEWNGSAWVNQATICTVDRLTWVNNALFVLSGVTHALHDGNSGPIEDWYYNWTTHAWTQGTDFVTVSELQYPDSSDYWRNCKRQPTQTPIFLYQDGTNVSDVNNRIGRVLCAGYVTPSGTLAKLVNGSVLVANTYSFTKTSDSRFKKTQSITKLADTAFKKTSFFNLLSDAAFIAGGVTTRSFNLLSNVAFKKTMTLTKASDVAFKKVMSITKSSDSRFKKTQTFTQPSDTRFKKTQSFTKSADSRYLKPTIFTKYSDVAFKKTMSFTRLSDAVFQAGGVFTYSFIKYANTAFKKTMSLTKSSDSRFLKTSSLTKFSNTAFKKAMSLVLNSNSRFMKTGTFTKASDVAFKKSMSFTKATDSRFRKTQSFNELSDTRFLKHQSFNELSNSYFTRRSSFNKFSDAVFYWAGPTFNYAEGLRGLVGQLIRQVYTQPITPVVYWDDEPRELQGFKPIIKVYTPTTEVDMVGLGYGQRKIAHTVIVDIKGRDNQGVFNAVNEVIRVLGRYRRAPFIGYDMIEFNDGTQLAGYSGFYWWTVEVTVWQIRRPVGI